MKTASPSPINQVRVDSLPLENKGAVELIVNPIFSSIGKFIVFPLRYLGSKTWSIPGIIIRTPVIIFMAIFYNKPITKGQYFGTGYAENSTKLESEESKEYLRYACFGLVPFRYEEDKWSNPFNGKIVDPKELDLDLSRVPGNVEAREKSFFDPSNLFKTVIIEDESELIVSFGPLHSHWHDGVENPQSSFYKLVISVIFGYAGLSLQHYQQADAIVEQLKSVAADKKKNLVVTGQSFAGALASYASLKHEVRGVCFNSVQLGAGEQFLLGTDRLANADKFLTHINVENDFLFAMPGISLIDKAAGLLGFKTPGNFGNRFHIPSAYSSRRDAHDFPIRSFMQHIGYGREIHANALQTKDIITSKKAQV